MSKVKKHEINEVKSERDLVMGDQYNITQVIHIPSFTPPSNLEKLRAAYLEHLRQTYRALDFKGIPQLDALSRELLLEEVYVSLVARPEQPEGETWERRLAGRRLVKDALPKEALSMADAQPVKVEEALGKNPRVVVLGDPGSGKSTLLKYLALRLAAEPGAPLPILVTLNAYAAAIETGDQNLQAYLPQYFAGLSHGLSGLQPLFDAALEKGQAVVLLDGLDEVQSERIRALLLRRVEAFAAETQAKIIITSRIVGYRESPLAAKTWSLYTLLDFDRSAIEAFAEKWCLTFEKSTLGDTPQAHTAAEVERRSLLDALDANPGVAQLGSNPLLLTILALIKRQGVSLPNRRIELYELYLKTLINAWSKARALDKRPVGPTLDYLQTIKVLGPLALWLREKNPTAGLVLEETLLDWLTEHFMPLWGLAPAPAREKAREFLDNVRKYSNLLLERGRGRYGFIHLTFEEALAARGLVHVGQINLENSLSIIRKYIADPSWRETILLAVGVWGIVREESEKASVVVRAMLTMDCGSDQPCQNVLMAGECLVDVGQAGLERAAALDVIAALETTSRNRALPPATQRDAGFILGRLAGQNPAFIERIIPDLDTWIDLPAGEFLYGDEKRKALIEQPFAIQKYPVTNLQFKKFMQDKGYERPEFWSETGWAWRTGTYDTKTTDKDYEIWLANRPVEKRHEPFFWHDDKWNNPLAPVLGVTWFEAEAYANWLARQLGKPVRLPSEQEWERAARGVQGREYAWEDAFDRSRLNCAEFWSGDKDLSDYSKWKKWSSSDSYKLASTAQVGQFPAGNTPDGICDLSGNVWEWTGSWYEKEQVSRILRGGGWLSSCGLVRCADRNRDIPDHFDYYIGFRLVSLSQSQKDEGGRMKKGKYDARKQKN